MPSHWPRELTAQEGPLDAACPGRGSRLTEAGGQPWRTHEGLCVEGHEGYQPRWRGWGRALVLVESGLGEPGEVPSSIGAELEEGERLETPP